MPTQYSAGKMSRKVSKKEKVKKKGADGGPRTGAKANKEALEEIKRRLDDCIDRDEYEQTCS